MTALEHIDERLAAARFTAAIAQSVVAELETLRAALAGPEPAKKSSVTDRRRRIAALLADGPRTMGEVRDAMPDVSRDTCTARCGATGSGSERAGGS
jgi:hypothetical protein